MDSCGSGYGPVAGSCERGNERSNYIKLGGGGGGGGFIVWARK